MTLQRICSNFHIGENNRTFFPLVSMWTLHFPNVVISCNSFTTERQNSLSWTSQLWEFIYIAAAVLVVDVPCWHFTGTFSSFFYSWDVISSCCTVLYKSAHCDVAESSSRSGYCTLTPLSCFCLVLDVWMLWQNSSISFHRRLYVIVKYELFWKSTEVFWGYDESG